MRPNKVNLYQFIPEMGGEGAEESVGGAEIKEKKSARTQSI